MEERSMISFSHLIRMEERKMISLTYLMRKGGDMLNFRMRGCSIVHLEPHLEQFDEIMRVEGRNMLTLKGPKREIFGLRIFAQIRPIWIGYLGTRPKNPKKLRLGPYIALYFPRFLC
jgi:hypothetical protein